MKEQKSNIICKNCGCELVWDPYILDINDKTKYGWWREKKSLKIHAVKICDKYQQIKKFEKKNPLKLKFSSWLEKHPNLWTNPMSIQNVIRAISGPSRVLPDFIIIGVTKSGTTSLYNYLINHPNVFPTTMKEIHYFDQHYQRGLNWYRANFPTIFQKFYTQKIQQKKFIVGEATPPYIHHPLVKERILDVIPNVKLIVMLRNPVERAFIHHDYQMKLGFENLPFMDAIKLEEKRLEEEEEKILSNDNYYSYPRQFHSYLFNGRYAEQLQKWLEIPKNQFLIINSDEFFYNTLQTFKKVQEFLELPITELDVSKIYNPSFIENMDPTIRKYLIEYFQPYNEKLYKLIGQRFNWNE